jgi:glutamine amidotransferase
MWPAVVACPLARAARMCSRRRRAEIHGRSARCGARGSIHPGGFGVGAFDVRTCARHASRAAGHHRLRAQPPTLYGGGVIAVVDACSGNLRSVQRALERAGATVVITADPEVVRRADKIVVPGQGAFGEFAKGMKQGLGDALKESIVAGKPYLGICLGLQVLFEASEEGGVGLGVLPGKVIRFRSGKVPHIGWNQVWGEDVLMRGIPDGSDFYFVHSYYPAAVATLECDYGGRFCAGVRKDNVFAVQFHPEKSQGVGIKLMENFVCG